MKRKLAEFILLTLFGGVMFLSKLLMEALPNIHLLAMFITLFTVLFRSKALISIYVYVMLVGVYGGFSLWWLPNLYTWAVLWAIVMCLPNRMPDCVAVIVYAVVCGLHGLIYGALGAPIDVLATGLGLERIWEYIIFGIPFDIMHCVGNILASLLIVPIMKPLKRVIVKYK